MQSSDVRKVNRRVGKRGTSPERHLTERHFARIAPHYASLRETDGEPILQIGDRLPEGPLAGVDVGAGTGRYTELLAKLLGDRVLLHAVDHSHAMLLALLQHDRAGERLVVCGDAEWLPIADGSVDFVTTFNAVHHFDLDRFAREVARVLAPNGDLFIYTRTPQQNARSIWGRAFPGFSSREHRLHDEAALRRTLRHLGTVDITSFSFARRATPARLAERVRGRAYSTFSLYDDDELEAALDHFLRGVDAREELCWQDHNLLVHVHRPG